LAWRKPHGERARAGETLVWENAQQDPAPPTPPTVAIERDKTGRVTGAEAARALAKLRGAVPDFVRRDLVCAPDFAPYDRQRKDWTRARLAELASIAGGASRGIGARVRAAGWGVAFGEYLASKAAETGDSDLMDRAMSILSKASVEDEKARRLAIDEAAARPPADPLAWMKAFEAKP
jgi:hypothetical protein